MSIKVPGTRMLYVCHQNPNCQISGDKKHNKITSYGFSHGYHPCASTSCIPHHRPDLADRITSHANDTSMATCEREIHMVLKYHSWMLQACNAWLHMRAYYNISHAEQIDAFPILYLTDVTALKRVGCFPLLPRNMNHFYNNNNNFWRNILHTESINGGKSSRIFGRISLPSSGDGN